jgi:hypothetical protein
MVERPAAVAARRAIPVAVVTIQGESVMQRLVLAVVFSFTLVALGSSVASAAAPDARHAPIGVGFHNFEAPLGLRWWLGGQKVAFDFGLGLNSEPAGIDPDEKETRWAIDFGVPIIWHSWESVHVIFRPGLFYESEQVGFDSDPTTAGIQYDTDNATTFAVLAELEAEVFLRDNISVSASHGIAYESFSPAFGGESQSSFGTFGNNFTNIGFHVYFLGHNP